MQAFIPWSGTAGLIVAPGYVGAGRVWCSGMVDVLDLGSPRPMGVGGVRRVPGDFGVIRNGCGIRVERVLVG